MISESFIYSILQFYGPVMIFAGSVLFGESIILTASVLSAQGLWSPFLVFLLAFLGTIISDGMWFFFGNRFMVWRMKRKKQKKEETNMLSFVEKISHQKPFYVLLFIKFLYGTRILTILYLAHRKISFTKFLLFDALGTIIWLIVLIPIGLLTGKGVLNLTQGVRTFEYIITTIAVLIIFYRLVLLWINKKFMKK